MLPCQSSVGKIIPTWQKGGGFHLKGRNRVHLSLERRRVGFWTRKGRLIVFFFLGTKLGLDSEVRGGLWNLDHV